jgi:hypothetical protein
MNPRIKELADQCWSYRVGGALIDGHLHFDYEKFALLIVRECAEKCVYVVDRQEILAHFGVEE